MLRSGLTLVAGGAHGDRDCHLHTVPGTAPGSSALGIWLSLGFRPNPWHPFGAVTQLKVSEMPRK